MFGAMEGGDSDSDSDDSAETEIVGPLHEAASAGKMDTCKHLVEQLGFDINAEASDDLGMFHRSLQLECFHVSPRYYFVHHLM